MSKTVFGWVASSITVVYKIPQIVKIYKTKKSADISILSLFAQLIGYIFYILHGHEINDLPIICMGAGALVENIILMIMYFIYHEGKMNNSNSNSNSSSNSNSNSNSNSSSNSKV